MLASCAGSSDDCFGPRTPIRMAVKRFVACAIDKIELSEDSNKDFRKKIAASTGTQLSAHTTGASLP